MNKCLELLTVEVCGLYRAFEDYAFNSYVKGDNRIIIVLKFAKNNTISYLLYDRNTKELLDECHLNFDGENTLYEALSLRLFAFAFGNVVVHRLDDNMYYNLKHKPYALAVASDEEVRDKIDEIVQLQEKYDINFEHEVIKNISSKVKTKKLKLSFIGQIQDRIILTNEVYKRW